MYELAIYGGTFDPVHIGHICAARAFFEAVKPDRLLIIPTLIPPHKKMSVDDNPQDRLEMLKIAFKDFPGYGDKLIISDYELNTEPPSYTVNTLRHFKTEDVHITFLVGTDMFLTLDKWKEPEEIFKLCTIAFMSRETDLSKNKALIDEKLSIYRNNYNADIKIINAPPIEISSSELRCANSELAKKYLPSGVYEYIKEHKLYENNRKRT